MTGEDREKAGGLAANSCEIVNGDEKDLLANATVVIIYHIASQKRS